MPDYLNKPPFAQVDWKHPLAHGLCFATILSQEVCAVDLVSGAPGRFLGTISKATVPGDMAWYTNTGSPGAILFDPLPAVEAITTGPLSVAFSYYLDTGSQGYPISKREDTPKHWAAFITTSDKLRFYSFNAPDYAECSSALTRDKWQHHVITVDGTTVRFYRDGRYIEQGSIGAITYAAARLTLMARLTTGTNVTYSNTAAIGHAYVWNRLLSTEEIHNLHGDPFQHLRPDTVALIATMIAPTETAVELSGTISGQTGVAGALSMQRPLSGAISAQSSVAGTLLLGDPVALSGAIEAKSGASAWLRWSVPDSVFDGTPATDTPWMREALWNATTHNAFQLGTALTGGWFWVRRAGCSALYRGPDLGRIDFVNVLVTRSPSATEISVPSTIAHDPEHSFVYAVRRYNHCGYQEQSLASVAHVTIGANGEPVLAAPNSPFGIAARWTASNRIQLCWYYCPLDQKAAPVSFRVLWNHGNGPIDGANPLATIPYQGPRHYQHVTTELSAGHYLFAVRPEGPSGEVGGTAITSVHSPTEDVSAVDILSVETS